jgi:hypothetical protein
MLFALWFLLHYVQSQTVTFLPTTYSSRQPFLFSTNNHDFALEMTLCKPDVYTGCTMVATVNLPFTDWSIDDGTYVNFTIYGEGDGCAKPICTSDPNAAIPNTCAWTYDASYGSRLYAVGSSGISAGFQATYNMEIMNCPYQVLTTAEMEKVVKNVNDKPASRKVGKHSYCPSSPATTKRTAGLDTSGEVPTSPKTSMTMKYFFAVCPDVTTYTQMHYRLQATDSKSAFATYFCGISHCSTGNSPPGWYDDSGTALNSVILSNLKNQFLWFDVYGWGEFHGVNSYRFSISLEDQ